MSTALQPGWNGMFELFFLLAGHALAKEKKRVVTAGKVALKKIPSNKN